MDAKLLNKLRNEARKILENNTRFHDYGHAIEVLENVQKLLIEEKEYFDKDILFASALFHDTSNKQDTPKEGIEGAEKAEKVLLKIKEFPREKIKEVKRLIIAHTKYGKKRKDEILFEAADQMAAFSYLGLLRSFMMFGKTNFKINDAIKSELEYLEKRYKKFKLKSARELVKKQYRNKKSLLEKLLL